MASPGFDVDLIILAGGKAKRLNGVNKPLIQMNGKSIIEDQIQRLESVVKNVVIVANDDSYDFLGNVVVPDITPNGGPLIGLVSGLARCTSQLAILVAGDMPFLSQKLFSHLIGIACGNTAQNNTDSGSNAPSDASCEDKSKEPSSLECELAYDVVIPRIGGRLEPTHCVYHVQPCHKAALKSVQENKRKVIAFHDQVRVHVVEEEELRIIDPDLLSFMNINTPDDLEVAKSISQKIS